MVESKAAVARRIDVSFPARCSSPWQKDGGLPSPTSPLDRAAPSPSPRGWRHRDGGGVGLGILAALEAQQQPTPPAPRVSAVVATRRQAARLEVSELGCSGRCATSLCGGGEASPSSAAFRVAEFLECCDMCKRALDGKDIFMYRGERAFCSMECRYHAIVADEFREEKDRKRRAAAAVSSPRKVATAEIAGSPCSGGGQIFFTTGIVAA
uniref:FLZ-type domain-containing protein n=1 Tax=Leersia perrieri TaxID=77586 RepID=A0A0D9VV36_9ORYZ